MEFKLKETEKRLDGCKDWKEAIAVLSEGNPGSVKAMLAMLEQFGLQMGFQALILLDLGAIYGSDIWVLYKDISNMEPKKVLEHLIGEDKEDLQQKIYNEQYGPFESREYVKRREDAENLKP